MAGIYPFCALSESPCKTVGGFVGGFVGGVDVLCLNSNSSIVVHAKSICADKLITLF